MFSLWTVYYYVLYTATLFINTSSILIFFPGIISFEKKRPQHQIDLKKKNKSLIEHVAIITVQNSNLNLNLYKYN